jgi:hypothetical protein
MEDGGATLKWLLMKVLGPPQAVMLGQPWALSSQLRKIAPSLSTTEGD